MDNRLTILKLSEKVKEYIKKVEEETGREVLIKSVQNVGMPGTCERFIVDCNSKNIYVEIIELCYCDEKGNLKQEQEEIDRSITHEVTHGLLAYKEKYCQFQYIRKPIEDDLLNSISILFTMIEDIVVNKRIDKNNFKPISQFYIDGVKEATKYMEKGKDIFKRLNDSPIIKRSFMIWSYIQPWGYLNYPYSYKIDKKPLHKFLKIFQQSYLKQYQEAKKIQEIIVKSDIFTRVAFDKTIRECLDLWNLADLVRLYTC